MITKLHMKALIKLFLICLLPLKVLAGHHIEIDDLEFEVFSFKEITKTIGEGLQEFSLSRLEDEAMVFYNPNVVPRESGGVSEADLYTYLDCESLAAYQIFVDKNSIAGIAVAVCQSDNTLLKERNFTGPNSLTFNFSSAQVLNELAKSNASTQSQRQIVIENDVYMFQSLFLGAGPMVAPVTIVNYSPNNDRVSVVQIFLDDFIRLGDGGRNSIFGKDILGSLIELTAKLLEFEVSDSESKDD